jgi:acetyl esterase/lipase
MWGLTIHVGEGLHVEDHDIPTTDRVSIAVRLYKPTKPSPKLGSALPLYISFHGGGFHLGSLETEDPHCRQVALKTGIAVLNVNYRHTPEWTFPSPVHDAWAAYEWAVQNASTAGIDAERIYIGGVSAGACLSISVALRAFHQDGIPKVQGLILGTPSTVHPDHYPLDLLRGRTSSLQTNANAPFINEARLRGFIELYKPDPAHPACSPLLVPTEEFRGLCPVSFHIAGLDPLRDEGLLFEAKLRDAG